MWWLLALSAIGVFVPVPLVAFPAAACLLLWIPGHAIVRLLPQVWVARGRTASALAAAMLFVPLPLTLVWFWTNDRFILAGSLVVLNAMLMLQAASPSHPPPAMFPARRLRWGFWLLVLYVGSMTLCFHWLPAIGGRLASSPSGDYIKHHAVLFSLDRHPLPLHNIYYAAEKDTPYYYYHYQYLLPATLRILTGRQISMAFAFGCFAGLAAALFISMVCLISLSVFDSPAAALFSGCLVSIVGGFDIIPVLIQVVSGKPMFVVLDSWVSFAWRIHNIADNFIWCPQHVAALMAFLACCYWLQLAPRARWWFLAGPLAAAAIFGSSVYQTMVIFGALGVYLLYEVFHPLAPPSGLSLPSGPSLRVEDSPSRPIWSLATVGLPIAIGLMVPQAIGYSDMSQRYPGGLTTQWDRFEYAFFGRMAPPGLLANFLDGWWLIIIDLGLPLLAFFFVQHPLRLLWRASGVRLLFISGLIGLVGTFIVRSNVTPYDYSFRSCVMPFNCVAAVLAGELLVPGRVRPRLRSMRLPVLAIGIVLGLPVGFYELPVMAVRTLLESKFLPGPDIGAVRFLRDQLPADAVVQGDPVGRVTLPQIIHRQMGVLDPTNPHIVILRPRDSAKMQAAKADIETAFTAASSEAAYQKFRAWGVTHVLAGQLERGRFGEMLQFQDPRFFDDVYKDAGATVYHLK